MHLRGLHARQQPPATRDLILWSGRAIGAVPLLYPSNRSELFPRLFRPGRNRFDLHRRREISMRRLQSGSGGSRLCIPPPPSSMDHCCPGRGRTRSPQSRTKRFSAQATGSHRTGISRVLCACSYFEFRMHARFSTVHYFPSIALSADSVVVNGMQYCLRDLGTDRRRITTCRESTPAS
jgi:hypothetical protein